MLRRFISPSFRRRPFLGSTGPAGFALVVALAFAIPVHPVAFPPSVGVGAVLPSSSGGLVGTHSVAPAVPASHPGTHVVSPPALAERTRVSPVADFSSVRMGNFHVSGHHPQSWGASDVPPGAPYPVGWVPPKPADASDGNGSLNSSVFDSGHCAGLYPDSGPSTYYDNCVGHDEPGIQFYSSLPGSAGNISWNVTLPLDTGVSQNQSNLYVAIWFGMTLSDPLAWMNQCFLELQFYPDSTWGANGDVNGKWDAAAVAWQIEAATGYEDPCYYSELYNNGIPGPTTFNMSEGDRLTVTMSGWETSPYGENITVVDHTTGNVSNVTLYDPYGNFPLNPAYSTNSYENGLQWTPGGEYPAVFSFETGHGRDPAYPSNTSFNYCDPGRPPATAANPYVPCPSYDPGSWANDSRQPWRIDVPTFFSGTQTEQPAQVSFSQDLGGINLVESSPGCPGNEGSAYCSYPWYSYSCSTHSFQFGATDYLGVTDDFGKYRQYAATTEINNLGNAYFAPTNFSIPSCGAPTAAVTANVAGVAGGQVDLLSHASGSSFLVSNLSYGEYSIHGIDGAAARFSSWSVSGGVTVDVATNSWATVTVVGNGTVTANFVTTPALTNVTFADSLTNASVAVFPNYLLTGNGAPIATVPNNGSLNLSSRIYSIEALPPPGYNFTDWSVSGPGAVVAASEFPDSWFLVTGAASAVTVRALYTSSTARAAAVVGTYGSGTVTFDGTTSTSWTAITPVGTFPISAHPAAGWTFSGWFGGGSLLLPDLAQSTNVTLETGTSYFTAGFTQIPVPVTFDSSPAAGGEISVPFSGTVANGTTVPVSPGSWTFYAAPSGGYKFSGWTVNNSSAAWALSPTSYDSSFLVNASATVTAVFVPAAVANLSFRIQPSVAGLILFNFQPYSNSTTNSSVAYGLYDLEFLSAGGFALTGSGTSGPLSLAGSTLTVAGTGGVVYANFTALPAPEYAVTFVSTPPNGTTASLDGTPLPQGNTVFLPAGTYPINGTESPNATFVGWTTSGGVNVSSAASPNTTLVVNSGGTVYALGIDFRLVAANVTPNPVDVKNTFSMHAVARGPAGRYFNYTWSGMPSECMGTLTVPVNTLVCTPTAPGSFSIGLTVSDAAGSVLTVPAFPLRVAPWPNITSFASSPSTFDLGVTTTITVVTSGGVGPLTYSYTGLPNGCSAQNVSTFTCTPLLTGTSNVSVHLLDTFGENQRAIASFTVHPDPNVVSFNTTYRVLTLGTSTNLTVVVGNGTGPYRYQYANLPAGCLSQNAPQLTCRATAAGAFEIRVNATDQDGFTASKLVFLQVNAPPKILSYAADPSTFTLGNGTNLTVDVIDGTGPLAYVYTGLPTGCDSANNTTIACHPVRAGNYTVRVTATDVFGANASASLYFNDYANVTGPGGAAAPNGSPGLPSLLVALVAAIAVGALLGVATGRRWPRPAPDEPVATSSDAT